MQMQQANALLDTAKANIEKAQRLIQGRPTSHINTKAMLARTNATLFDGKMNGTQRACILGFAFVYAMFVMLGMTVPLQYLAYVLATTYHETGRTMKPIEEWGKGQGRPYGEPDPDTGETYYGRGYVQLTWLANYIKAKAAVYNRNWQQGTIDFVSAPELALNPFYAAQIAISGMMAGWFTGKKLSDYLQADGSFDYINARRIINGTDKAETIAAYAIEFETALYLGIGTDIERATLQHGSKGDDVRELQLGLGLNPDGKFGNATQTALIHFQQQHQLNDDGICGASTWTTFEKEIYGL
ncbi:peptidoglycan-binding protein [Vibrio parahaemolyticus]|nr:peptidoglycan-binding protein [Vibrio parahaemolyticus]